MGRMRTVDEEAMAAVLGVVSLLDPSHAPEAAEALTGEWDDPVPAIAMERFNAIGNAERGGERLLSEAIHLLAAAVRVGASARGVSPDEFLALLRDG